jgi:integrase
MSGPWRVQEDEFRAWLLAKNATTKTSRDRFTWVKSLLKYTVRDLEALPKSPWEGLDIASKTTARRRPWKPDEIRRLFGQPLFTTYELPEIALAGQDAAYWIPLIGLFSGARTGELAQLRVVDVDASAPAPFMSITNEGERQKIKTDAGIRVVPVHPELVRLGFLDYVGT